MTATQAPSVGETVVLVGASVRAAAESARRGGFRVIGIDLFGDLDTRAACDAYFQIPNDRPECAAIDSIVNACRGRLMAVVGGLTGRHDELLAALSSSCLRWGPTPTACSAVQQAAVLSNLATEADFRFPQTYDGQPLTAGRSPPTRRWLIKRPGTCGGLGVGWWRGQPLNNREIVQQWIAGRCYGATCYAADSGVKLLGVCRSRFTRIGSRPFVYAGSIGPVPVADSVWNRLLRLATVAHRRICLPGLFGIDFIVDSMGDPWLLEINPRWTASMELLERSWDLCDGSLMAYALRGTPSAPPPRRKFVKRIVYARCDGRFCRAALRTTRGSGTSLHDLPAEGTAIRRGEPIMTFIQPIDRGDESTRQHYRSMIRMIASRGDNRFAGPIGR